ncbi:MAG: hypothetical protein IIA44_11375 [Acidobacteria bacterium]|nr:hypothetical protein [Acidobacteriota bacterium]
MSYVPLSNLTVDLTVLFSKQIEASPGTNHSYLTRPDAGEGCSTGCWQSI